MLADLRRPHGLLARAEEYNIDFSQPVGLLLTGVLHHLIWPEAPHLQVAELTRRLAPGSYLALSHITCHDTSTDIQAGLTDITQWHANGQKAPAASPPSTSSATAPDGTSPGAPTPGDFGPAHASTHARTCSSQQPAHAH